MDYPTLGEAIQIAYVKENKLIFSTDAFREVLGKVGNRPVSILSFNGLKGTEKTYILSQSLKYLLNYTEKNWFNLKNEKVSQWQNSADEQTPGISLWSEPIIIKKSGDEVAVLLLDIQGCFDEIKSTPEDMLIFALSFVLSSTLIHSIPERLSEKILQFMQLFVGYAKGSIEPNIPDNFFKLIFMVKGWAFPDKYEFGYHDGAHSHIVQDKNYKMLFLLELFNFETDPKEICDEIWFTHHYTDSNLPRIACCLLPGHDSTLYDENDNLPNDFVDTVTKIIPRIMHPSNVAIKKIGNNKFKGPDLIKFFDQLAVLFSENEIPHHRNSDDYNTEMQIFIAHLTAFNYYVWEMDKIFNEKHYTDHEQLKKLHNKNMEKAIALYTSKKPLENEIKTETIMTMKRDKNEALQDMIQHLFDIYLQANEIRFNYFKTKQRTQKMKDEMEKQIKDMKDKFFTSCTEVNSGISKLIGFDLEGLTRCVQTVFGGLKNGHF